MAVSDRGGERAAAMYSLTVSQAQRCRPESLLADVLARIGDHPAAELDELLLELANSQAGQAAAA